MQSPEECKNIEEVRAAIDLIDHQIVQSIARRAEYVKKASAFKKNENAVKDEARVKKVIESKKQLAVQYNIPEYLIEDIYRVMINHFIKIEMEEWKFKPLIKIGLF